jgi:hypothetical protein
VIFTKIPVQMRDLYDRLKLLGFNRTFLRECVFPEWWEDEMASVPANRAIVEAILSRQLSLDLAALRDPHGDVVLQPTLAARYKMRAGLDPCQLDVAQVVAARLATIAASCFDTPLMLKELSTVAIRNRILHIGAPWVGLDQLLDVCWEIGVPVVHLCRLPQSSKKMDGMVCWAEGRPVIVMACQRKATAWQLFILAHELGHVACGHLLPDSPHILDDKVDTNVREQQEKEANEFAVTLLTGKKGMVFRPQSSFLTGAELAETATELGTDLKIDPGFIALNYSWNQTFFPVAMAAINLIEPEANAAAVFRSRYTHLDLEALPQDSQRLFQCLTMMD